MKLVALISGGKDSCYNMMQCVAMGHQIVALANLQPLHKGETDSYMYQTVGSEAIQLYSEAMELPLYRRTIKGFPKSINMSYHEDTEDEVEDLYLLLKSIQNEMSIDGVSCGAILSDYQRVRVENICLRLNLISFSYLWRREQKELLQDMIDHQVTAILIKTAALGLVPWKHLGKTLKEMQSHLLMLNSKYGSHVCGEGGEYETFTLDCPLFKKRIVIDESETVLHSDDGIVTVAYLSLQSMHLEEKSNVIPFDFGLLVPKALETEPNQTSDKAKQLEDQNADVKQNFVNIKWMEVDNKDIYVDPSVSVCSQQGYLSISNLIGICKINACDDDIKLCTRNVFAKLIDFLNGNGHKPSNLIYIHLYISDMSNFTSINSVYKRFFPVNPPARICVALQFGRNIELEEKGDTVIMQVDCISLNALDYNPKIMHVQGYSHWAPANIGPYSQCVMSWNTCFVAGQIGLVPGTMRLAEGGIGVEARIAMQHVEKILSAMDTSLSTDDIIQCVCYISNDKYLEESQIVWNEATDQNVICEPVFITTPSLPRICAVEWQVIACKNFKPDLDDCHPTESVDIVSWSAFYEKTGNLVFVEAARSLLMRLRNKIENANMKWKSILQIRLFYVNNNTCLTDAQCAVNRLLITVDDFLPSISCVPVQSIHQLSSKTSVAMAMVCILSKTVIST